MHVKFNDGTRDWWMDWGTMFDSPNTTGDTLEEYRKYIKEEWGRRGLADFDSDVERGKYNTRNNLEQANIKNNRAGPNGKRLTEKQIIQVYCHKIPLNGWLPEWIEGDTKQ
jgi:hypothetical protein